MNRKVQSFILSYLIPLGIGISSFLTSCGSNTNGEIMSAQGELSSEILEITQKQLNASEMKFSAIEKRKFNEIIQTNGIFDLPPRNLSSVSTYFGGFVSDVNVLPGENVRKGQVLFILENPEYVEIQEKFLDAKSQLAYLKSDYERKKSLFEDSITSRKDYLKAEADYTSTEVKFQALQKKLTMMNINPETLTPGNIQTSLKIFAPISGSLSKVNISRGVYVHPADMAMTISDMDHLHLELTIFEKDLHKIKEGQKISFSTQGEPEALYDGTVFLVNRTIDTETRTASLHGHIDTPELDKFSPGMYVEAEIYTGTDTSFSLPESAVTKVDQEYYVLKTVDDTADTIKLEKIQVQVGKSDGGFVEIKNHADFSADSKFLMNGTFKLVTE